jgi:hypothetical protein
MYLPAHHDNPLLARFLFAQEVLVQEVFKSSYNELIQSIYKDDPAKLYHLAAQSLEQGGWLQEAALARQRL